MPIINAKINDEILNEFRDVIYRRKGLKKGDFKEALENAMLDYIQKYSKTESAREKAKQAKTRQVKNKVQ